MKKIMVATDFSAPAENAAKYALAFARAIQAEVTLVNAYTAVIAIPSNDMAAWPVIDYQDVPPQIGGELDVLVKKLFDESCSDTSTTCPKVSYRCEQGSVIDVMQKLAVQINPDLQVMGISGAGGMVNFILGSNSMAMIEIGSGPVLLVPFGAKFYGVKRIAYAGTLSPEDLKPLEYLCKLASWFDAEVAVVHVLEKRGDYTQGNPSIGSDFIDQVRMLTGYQKLIYQPILNRDVDRGLDWINQQEDITIVAMLHHKHNILQKIFQGSRTKRFARFTQIPLLVFPPAFT